MDPDILRRILDASPHVFLLFSESGQCQGYVKTMEGAVEKAKDNDFRIVFRDNGSVMQYRPGEKPEELFNQENNNHEEH